MTKSEIEALIKDAAKTDFGFACCHGRPTMVQLDQDWFEKQFSR
jgi:DNA mismatch repair ATPase MutL